MAKKFVRGITGIKNIKKQDLDTNNVNDLLSDGEHNYIHRKKKDKTEEYHNLTNNIKTIDSDNTALLSVTNYNNTKNSATLHPHHDAQKEQKLYSTDGTIDIVHGDNGTGELTNVDVNPKKVLTHDKLVSNSQYVTVSHNQNSDTTQIKTDKLNSEINELKTKVNQSSGGGNKILLKLEQSDDDNQGGFIAFYMKHISWNLDRYPSYSQFHDSDVEVNFIFTIPKGKSRLVFSLGNVDAGVYNDFIQPNGDRYDHPTIQGASSGWYFETDGCIIYIDFNNKLFITRENTTNTQYISLYNKQTEPDYEWLERN